MIGLRYRPLVASCRQALHDDTLAVRVDSIDRHVIRFEVRQAASVRVPYGFGDATPNAFDHLVERW